MRRPPSRLLTARLASAALAATLALLTACGDDDDPPTVDTGAITVALSASTLALTQGESETATVTVTRAGGFAGPVALTAEGAPAGVTVAFAPASVPGAAATTTLTATASAEAAPGSYPITVRASGQGVESKTVQLSLTVAAAQTPAYTLTVSPASLTVGQGARDSAAIQIVRAGGFTGPVALTLSGVPEAIARGFSRSPVSDDTSTVKFQIGAEVPPGVYPVTILGIANGQRHSVQLSLTVMARSSTTVSFTGCLAGPTWVGMKDGDNPWQRVTAGPDGKYTVKFFSSRGGIASLEDVHGFAIFKLTVFYASADEMRQIAAAAADQACDPLDPDSPPGSKTINGSVANVGAEEIASVALGSSVTNVIPEGGATFALANVEGGPRDLIAARVTAATFSPNTFIVRRALDPADGSTLPVLDFDAAEAFVPVSSEVTVSGIGGDQGQLFSQLTTANGTSANLSFATEVADGAFDYYGFPADELLATDLQQVLLTASTPGDDPPDTRMAAFYFRSTANRTLALGPKLNPTVTSLGPRTRPAPIATPSQLLRAVIPVQTDYDLFATVSYTQGLGGNEAHVSMTSGYRGNATSWTLDIPDLSDATGYDPAWELSTAFPVAYTATACGGFFRFVTGGTPDDGDSFQCASHSGTLGGSVSRSLLRQNSSRLTNRYLSLPQPPHARRR